MPDRRRSVLFVDDEPKILRGLRRSLTVLSKEWDTAFADSGARALQMLAERPYDVIVSDMRMPGMDGVELLNEVRRRYPHMVRIALSGQSAKESVLSSIGPIHQYLPKPCDVETLRTALWRLCALRRLLGVEKLKGMLSEMEKLPSLPSMYHRLMKAFESPDSSIRDVGRIISEDLGMSAKVLQLVNSAFFGKPRRVSCPSEAVIALGMDTVRALAMTVCVFAPLEQRVVDDFPFAALWEHGLAVGTIARDIARAERVSDEVTGEAFTAGLLHDVGKLALSALVPDEYRAVHELHRDEGLAIRLAEQRILDTTHAEVGAYLLGLWGFSHPVMGALAYHHDPAESTDEGFGTIAAVHAANVLAHESETLPWPHSNAELDVAYLQSLGLADRPAVWKERCQPKGATIS